MITSFFTDLNRYLRIRINRCYKCGHKLEFRPQMKVYYCNCCHGHIKIEKELKIQDVEHVAEIMSVDIENGILDIKSWKS